MRLLGEWLDEKQNRFTMGLIAHTAQLRFDIDLSDRGKPTGLVVETRDIAALYDSLRYRRALVLTSRDGATLRLQPVQESAFSFDLNGSPGAAGVAGRLLYAIADHMVAVIDGALSAASAGPFVSRLQR